MAYGAWTIYTSPRVYNSFPTLTNNAMRQDMMRSPGQYAPPYDHRAVGCYMDVAHAMAKYQDGVLPFDAILRSHPPTTQPPYSGPRRNLSKK